MSPQINLYFHILQGRPLSNQIVAEIQSALVFSGLYDRCDSLTAITVGPGTVKGILYPRWRLFHAGDDPELFEYPTLKGMWEDAKTNPENISIYIHTKGTSRPDRIGSIWRRLMMHGIFSKHDEALEALEDGYDAAGCFWRTFPCLHPSGNWFFVKNSILNKLAEPAPTEEYPGRLNAEMWLTTNKPKYYELMDDPSPFEILYRSESYREVS